MKKVDTVLLDINITGAERKLIKMFLELILLPLVLKCFISLLNKKNFNQ
jgi:hypothetical protein